MDNYIGRPALQAGLKSYVEKYAYKNSELVDLVTCMDEAIKAQGSNRKVDLLSWTDDWLKKKGPNVLSVDIK